MPQRKRKKRPEVTPVVWRFKDVPRTSILTQSRWFITTTFLKYCFSVPPGSKKHEFLHFPKNVADTPQGCPNNVPKWRLFEKKITKHITVVIFFTILFHQMCCMKYWKVNFAYSKCHTDELKTSPKDVRKLTSFKSPRDVSFQPLIQTPYRCIICNLISRNVDLKYQNVSCGILLLYVSTWSPDVEVLRISPGCQFWTYITKSILVIIFSIYFTECVY